MKKILIRCYRICCWNKSVLEGCRLFRASVMRKFDSVWPLPSDGASVRKRSSSFSTVILTSDDDGKWSVDVALQSDDCLLGISDDEIYITCFNDDLSERLSVQVSPGCARMRWPRVFSKNTAVVFSLAWRNVTRRLLLHFMFAPKSSDVYTKPVSSIG